MSSARSFVNLGNGKTVESFVEKWNGRVFIGYSNRISAFFDTHDTLKEFLDLPLGSPSLEQLDEWLKQFDDEASELTPASTE